MRERERDFHFKPKKFSDVINLIRVISLFLYSFDIHFNEFSYLTHHDLTFSLIIYLKKEKDYGSINSHRNLSE